MTARWLTTPLASWVAFVARHGWGVLAVLGLLTLVFGWVAVERFRINSNLSDLIEQEAPWREDFDRYEAAFPDMVRTTVVVVSGRSYKGVEDATLAVEARLRDQEDFFRTVYAPQNDAFFRERALLYLSHEELDDMVDRIASAQPMLTAVAEDPSLRSILELVAGGLDSDRPDGFDIVVRILADSAEALVAGEEPQVAWTDEFFQPEGTLYRLIFLKGRVNFGATLSTAEIMGRVRATVAQVPVAPGVSVRVTGEVALQHEEIEAAVGGVQLAGWLSIALLVVILVVGVRSLKIISATFLMLFVGIVWTSAYAMLAVGEYNTLSIIFLVMFFGLGVDFAIHYSLRYQEAVNSGDGDVVGALVATTRSVGGAIATCTATTSIGFLGFLPTEYKGLADLGVISAGGMLVAAALTFTLLPAFYAVAGTIRPHTIDLPTGDRLVAALLRRRGYVFALLAIAAALAAVFAMRIYFDYSVLALKDADSESMQTLRDLQDAGVTTDYSLVVLSEQPLVDELLEDLPTVDSVTTPWDYVPKDQDEKLYVLDDLQQILWSALEPARRLDPPSTEELSAQLSQLTVALGATAEPELLRLQQALTRMQQGPPARLLVWQEEVTGNLLDELEWLRVALAQKPVEFADLPQALQERLVSADGQYLSIVTPAGNVADVTVLSEFVEGVRERVPIATGRPVIEWGVGQIVVDSFRQALVFATLGILAVLVIVFRNLRDGIMILIPLMLTAVFTLAVSVLADLPLNMANILVLPLIFGLGVDNGIHVVDRFHHGNDVGHFMHSSTPRAVMLSALTTIGAFAALSFSPHQGTASVGILLAVAISLLLVFTIFVLPLLLSVLSPVAAGESAATTETPG